VFPARSDPVARNISFNPYSVCIDPTNDLPRIVRSHEHNLSYVYTFTNWNATSVTLPKDIATLGK